MDAVKVLFLIGLLLVRGITVCDYSIGSYFMAYTNLGIPVSGINDINGICAAAYVLASFAAVNTQTISSLFGIGLCYKIQGLLSSNIVYSTMSASPSFLLFNYLGTVPTTSPVSSIFAVLCVKTLSGVSTSTSRFTSTTTTITTFISSSTVSTIRTTSTSTIKFIVEIDTTTTIINGSVIVFTKTRDIVTSTTVTSISFLTSSISLTTTLSDLEITTITSAFTITSEQTIVIPTLTTIQTTLTITSSLCN